MKSKTPALRLLAALGCVALSLPAAAQLNTLVGWAKMPANTFADGPTSGQFASGAGGNPLPLLNKQPVATRCLC